MRDLRDLLDLRDLSDLTTEECTKLEEELARRREGRKKHRDRAPHYYRLGFVWSEVTFEFTNDDELWEKMKDRPVDPNNRYDRFIGQGVEGDCKAMGITLADLSTEEAEKKNKRNRPI